MGKDLYSVLEVDRGANSSDIRKQYLKLSRVAHPDKGGDAEKFKELQQAYEVLSDERGRSIYDQTGQIPGEQGAGFPGGMGGMGFPPGFHPGGGFSPQNFPFDIGNMFGMFGENVRQKKDQRQRGKAPPKKTTIALSLHDFYHGKTVEMRLQQQRFCPDCRGEGSKTTSACEPCHGQGVVNQITQMGPMIMKSQGPCPSCSGSGKKLGPPCGLCSGSKFVKRDKTIQVVIQKGSKHGDILVLEGESSHVEQWTEPGDVLIGLEAADTERSGDWVRQGDNLTQNLTICLKDSLCGAIYVLQGHPGFPAGFSVEIPAGIQSQEKLTIVGCGMPIGVTGSMGDCVLTITIAVTESDYKLLSERGELLRDIFKSDSLEKQREGKPQPIWTRAARA